MKFAQNGYCKCGDNRNYTGKEASWGFYREYVKEFYEPIYEKNKDIHFVDNIKYNKCTGDIVFDGKYVKIKRVENDFFVYTVSLWLLGGCHEKARKENPVLFNVV